MDTQETFDRYVREDRLGSGAMGEVWAVRDTRSGARLAMKTVFAAQDESVAARFDREIALQSRVQHRSVPRVLDRGVDASGVPWFTMDRVDGITLAALAREGRPVAFLLRVFVELCRAVEHAHRRGVVHRDLKPENVLVGADGSVHVVDWGLAELVGTRPTATGGLVVGTPGYIAPELARGDGTAAHASGDVFALGAVLFELLQGEPLYPQKHPLGRLTATLLEGDPLAQRAPLPPALAPIVRTAIAREASARFASAEALALAVELAIAPVRVSARIPRVHAPVPIGLAAAAALGLLALTPMAPKAAPMLDAARDHVRALASALDWAPSSTSEG